MQVTMWKKPSQESNSKATKTIKHQNNNVHHFVRKSKEEPTTISVVGEHTNFIGSITSQEIVDILGTFNGDITGVVVNIRENAKIEGKIIAEVVRIQGYFDGDIFADRVVISKTAKFNGKLNYSIISVEDGAEIDGEFIRKSNPINHAD